MATSKVTFVAALAVASVWIFPFTEGPSPDALQQIYAATALPLAAMLFGFNPVSRQTFWFLCAALILMAFAGSTYWANQIFGMSALLIGGIACHLGVRLRQSLSGLVCLIGAILFASVVNACEGLLQWFGLVSSLWPWVVEPERRGVAFGAFRQLNLFSSFLCIGVICAIWLLHLRKLSEPLVWFLASILVLGVAASGSRTGGIELLALVMLAWVYRQQQTAAVTRVMIGQFFIFCAATMLLPFAAELHGFEFATSLSRAGQSSQYSRLTLWSNAIDMIAARPWGGWGWAEIGYAHYTANFGIRFGELVGNAHNLPLQIAVEFGLPTSIFVISITLWSVFKGRPWLVATGADLATDSGLENRSFAWAILLILVGIHSMLEFPLWYVGFIFLVGFAIGFLLPTMPETSLVNEDVKYSTTPAYLSAVIVVTLSTIGLLQYQQVLQISKAPFGDILALKSAVANANNAWLFRGILDYHELGLIALTAENAAATNAKAMKLLHYYPGPLVAGTLIVSNWHLGKTAEVQYHEELFCRAFPLEYSKWLQIYINHPLADSLQQPLGTCMLRSSRE